MPLLRFSLYEGVRDAASIRHLLDITHQVATEVFALPAGDRYQLVELLPPAQMVIEDSGLGYQRSAAFVLLQVFSRPRPAAARQRFYAELASALAVGTGLAPDDLMVTFVTNADADWSFGRGRAEFLLGDL